MAKAKEDIIKRFLTDEMVLAAKTGDVKKIDACLKKGGDINACGTDGEPIVIIAIKEKGAVFALEIVKRGADVNARSSTKAPLCYLAGSTGNIALVKALGDGGCDFFAANKDGKTIFDIVTDNATYSDGSVNQHFTALRDYLVTSLPDAGAEAPRPEVPPVPEMKKKPFTPGSGVAPNTGGP